MTLPEPRDLQREQAMSQLLGLLCIRPAYCLQVTERYRHKSCILMYVDCDSKDRRTLEIWLYELAIGHIKKLEITVHRFNFPLYGESTPRYRESTTRYGESTTLSRTVSNIAEVIVAANNLKFELQLESCKID